MYCLDCGEAMELLSENETHQIYNCPDCGLQEKLAKRRPRNEMHPMPRRDERRGQAN